MVTPRSALASSAWVFVLDGVMLAVLLAMPLTTIYARDPEPHGINLPRLEREYGFWDHTDDAYGHELWIDSKGRCYGRDGAEFDDESLREYLFQRQWLDHLEIHADRTTRFRALRRVIATLRGPDIKIDTLRLVCLIPPDYRLARHIDICLAEDSVSEGFVASVRGDASYERFVRALHASLIERSHYPLTDLRLLEEEPAEGEPDIQFRWSR